MRYDRLCNVIGDDNESKRSTVYWSNVTYERSSLSLDEYKERKRAQLREDCRLPFAVTLLPTLNLPGSLLREVKKQERFTRNTLYSDAVLSASFLINWIKVVTCLTMLRLLVTFFLSYQKQGLQGLDIVQDVSYDACKHKLNEIYRWGLRIRSPSIVKSFNATDESSLNRLILRSFSERIERLSPSWWWLFKGILLLSLVLLLTSKLVKKLNRLVYGHVINLSKKKEDKLKIKKPVSLVQVLKNLSLLDIFDVIRCSVFLWGSDKNRRFCLQTYLTKKILDAYMSISKELKIHYPSNWERKLTLSVTSWMEQKLNNVIRDNTSFKFKDEDKGLVEFKTRIYPIREGTQYINVVDDSDLACSIMAVMSRNESSIKSLSLPDYKNPINEYHSHGSTKEATMRSIELRKISWLLPYVIFNVSILFGMETSTRVLDLKPNSNLVRTPWEEVWERGHEDLKKLSEMDGRIDSAYSKDNTRMFTLMNFQTSCNLTIPNNRHLAHPYSIAKEILSREELWEIHPDAMLLMDQMRFIGVDEDRSQSRNRIRLISGISLVQPESNLIGEEINLTHSDFWDRYVSIMIPNLELTISKEAIHGDENNLDELVIEESKNETHYCRFDPTLFDLSHVDVRFSLITSLIASRDVQRHRSGSNWNHKVLSLDKKPVIHPFYTNSKVTELMKDFPISLEGRKIKLTDLLQFPSSSLMKLSNRMSFENIVFLLKTRIQSNPEYALLFAGFYLKLLRKINSIDTSVLNEKQKSFLRKQLTSNIKVDEVVEVIDKSVKTLRPNLSDSDCKVTGNSWRSMIEKKLI